MGFFSKLKSNIHHGGVKVQVQAPGSATANQSVPITVTISADSTQTITSVKAQIKARVQEQGLRMGHGEGVGLQSSTSSNITIAEAENKTSFIVNPGETKTVTLELVISGNATGYPLGPNGAGALNPILQTVTSAVQGLEHLNYLYSVHASADVQGIALDPSDSTPIQILPAAASGSTVQN